MAVVPDERHDVGAGRKGSAPGHSHEEVIHLVGLGLCFGLSNPSKSESTTFAVVKELALPTPVPLLQRCHVSPLPAQLCSDIAATPLGL